ncbi:hypothetical protein PGB28_02695 [Primorskyibacter aestuariivivens]|uniref:hypothetical protein n=1 Tax=Primorskyibacter aestuariivivens TaxID=1888912 RepID=UPI0022FFFBA7|nr:hypothetical protein [Primorskyibacter aestuariivivens]MDA7427352.1 hypothetical protein [Primorskyibacter aestuariivivens]
MKRICAAVLGAAVLTQSAPLPAHAGTISTACMQSGRKAANRSLCKCIQFVADQSLSRADQRLAASFFRDPHKAQEIRQSDRANHEAFWERYKLFGAQAESFCKGY